MDRKTAISKIRKCLARATGTSSEHESAAAIRQAQALKAQFDIDDDALLAAEVTEAAAHSTVRLRPARWESLLCNAVAQAFGCDVLHQRHPAMRGPSNWLFVGCGSSPEIATYAFTVLLRKLKNARAQYIKTHLKRLIAKSKTRRADLFCEAWVMSVWSTVAKFARSDIQTESIDAYKRTHFPAASELKSLNRNEKRNMNRADISAWAHGQVSGERETLQHGVAQGNREQLALPL